MKQSAIVGLIAAVSLVNLALLSTALWLLLADRDELASEAPASPAAGPGGPLAGLSPEELRLFREGRVLFRRRHTSSMGLGPVFNGTSCDACHFTDAFDPIPGGPSPLTVVRFGRTTADGRFDPLPGGSLLQRSFFVGSPPECREVLPPQATIVARRITTPTFGAGLIEAIPDATLLGFADPDDRDGDGISGRAHRVPDRAAETEARPRAGADDRAPERVGRFGWKAQRATLLGFSADAYQSEMGITNDLFPDEVAPNGDRDRLITCDPVADPEDRADPRTGLRAIDKLANYLRLLAAPPRGRITGKVERGEDEFRSVGCADCHVPEMMTGSSPIAALDLQSVPLYSDLLLHDIGTGDGIVQGRAAGTELRTPPLWGLRFRRVFLHDGRAATLERAIREHAAEATQSRRDFEALPEAKQSQLLAFLGSL